MPDLTIISVSILAFAVSIASFMLFSVEHKKSKEAIKKQSDEAFAQAQAQSNQILTQAVKKAQLIVAEAEAEEIRLIQDGKHLTQKFEQAAEKQFHDSSGTVQQHFSQELQTLILQMEQAQKGYYGYLNGLKSQVDQAHQDSLELIKQQVNGLFERFEQNLSAFLGETEQKTIYSIDLELKATRELINTYKQQQLRLIDENLVAILERTLSLVLSKKLSVKDQLDLITEALEKAKQEKFIV